MNRVLVVFSDGLLSELDSARGLVSRSAWIRQAVEDKLMKEAVAPLVPDTVFDGRFPFKSQLPPVDDDYQETPEETEILDRMHGITPNEFDAYKAEPKPKARRKKKVGPPKEYDFAKDRPEGCACTYDMLGRIWNSACKIHDSASDRTQRYVDNLLPDRCNRGACTGTINPVSGRCLHCNQTPLKESK